MPQDEEEVSYERLQELVRAERRSNKLMPVPARFWAQVRDFLDGVAAEFREAQQRDPWSRKAMLLSDEVKNAKHAAENLWTLRERKLAMLSLARQPDRKRPEGITADEAQLYEGMQEVLDRFRQTTFAGTVSQPSARATAASGPQAGQASTGSAPAPTTVPVSTPGTSSAPPPDPSAPPASAVGAPASMGEPQRQSTPLPTSQETPAAPSSSQASPPTPAVVPSDRQGHDDSVTIRALGDIPPFVGPDMQTYLLREGDLATVPPSIATLLVKRKKAAVVEGL